MDSTTHSWTKSLRVIARHSSAGHLYTQTAVVGCSNGLQGCSEFCCPEGASYAPAGVPSIPWQDSMSYKACEGLLVEAERWSDMAHRDPCSGIPGGFYNLLTAETDEVVMMYPPQEPGSQAPSIPLTGKP